MIAQSVGAFPLLIRGALARWLSATCLLSGRRHLPNSCQPTNRLVPRTITGWRSLANKLRLPSRLGEMQAATSEGRHWCLLVWSGRTFSGLPVPDSHPTRFTSRATRALRRGNHSDTLLKPQILRVTPFGITGITVTLWDYGDTLLNPQFRARRRVGSSGFPPSREWRWWGMRNRHSEPLEAGAAVKSSA